MISLISSLIPFGALLLLIALGVSLVAYLTSFISKPIKKQTEKLFNTLHTFRTEIIFILSFGSVMGSLFYSEILHMPPCSLCWYGRIIMYPIALISAVALYYNKKDSREYILPLGILGAILSLYHIAVQAKWINSFLCSTDGNTPCNVIQLQAFGFLTIPMMGLLVYITIIALLARK
jgi:disulfide bond formation protein DsbB